MIELGAAFILDDDQFLSFLTLKCFHMSILILNVEYQESDHSALAGRGVFTTTPIPSGTIIETCAVLVLGLEESEQHIKNSSLYHYT
jgi:hypothetical protein